MKQPVLLAVLVLAGLATAQGRGPLPGIPMTPPPVDHPALAAQPLFQTGGDTRPTPPPELPKAGPSKAGPSGPEKEKPAEPKPDPDTFGPKIGGKDLKKAVAKVADLKWHDSLAEARAQSAALGKPILWIQALGEIDGFA